MHKIIIILLLLPVFMQAQETVKGKVLDENKQPLPGAGVVWENTSITTSTVEDGTFEIPYSTENMMLIISYVGYKTDTLHIMSPQYINHQLVPDNRVLGEVILDKTLASTRRSMVSATNTSTMGSRELLKAACCNVAESFETNPSIDVNFSDALTGTRQIRMLGLTSPYLLIAEENIPAVRGASQAYGLTFVPGTWVESIQVTKGAGPVINGYESISGQINYELIKPVNGDPFFLNAYAGMGGRYELNTHFTKKVSDKWSTSLFAHGNTRVGKYDMNNDGFLDNPLAKQINVMNRWQYIDAEKGWVSFINLRYMKDEKQAGQVDFDPDRDKFTTNHWGSEINTDKVDVSTKLGYVWPDMPYQSIGLQTAFNYHNQESYFGFNKYNIAQKSGYANLIFNSIIDNTLNKFAIGANAAYDNYDERVFIRFNANGSDYDRIDNSVGVFAEYTYDNADNFSLVLGGRFDVSNRLGAFATPRLHLRYNPWESGTLRVSAGRGKRAANIFAENQQYFGSSRSFNIFSAGGKLYGLDPEIAWNYGLSFTQNFPVFNKNAEFTVDFYRTDFQNQVVVDVFNSPRAVSFYNLDGKSYANSLQLELNYELTRHFNIRTAYKYYDIKTDYASLGSIEKPLQAKHRFFANAAYETHVHEGGKQWKFDLTYNWLGKQKLPYTGSNPAGYQMGDYSPAFATLNAQVTHSFSSVFEIYVGGENIGNYRQTNAILGANEPFGSYFDTSLVYGPVFGQMYYAGLRFKVK
ncbi:TonB-dependent receptor domain-containing protein [Flavobacterium sp. RHBU_24]|uniref:TonB-dependent receptor plug domain-containing protein n=1 Tax=Flavobacterium sp. RHBU_24 TaxID=3391185 RepID=UPI0039852678